MTVVADGLGHFICSGGVHHACGGGVCNVGDNGVDGGDVVGDHSPVHL